MENKDLAELEEAEIEHRIFQLLARGISGRGNPNTDIPELKRLAALHGKARYKKEAE